MFDKNQNNKMEISDKMSLKLRKASSLMTSKIRTVKSCHIKFRKKKKEDGGKKAENISQPKNLKQYRVTCDYQKQDRGEIDLEAGMIVEVAEKSETGWWFVNSEDSQGWVPSTYLEPADGSTDNVIVRAQPGQEEKYICIEDFNSGGDDEISLDKGAVVEVLEKNLAGWWLVRHQGREGFAPATYLKKTDDEFAMSLAKRKSTEVQIITNLSDISNIMKNKEGDSSPRTSIAQSGDMTRNSLAPPGDNFHNKLPNAEMYSKVQSKSRSLERGGNLKPPPRQSVIKKPVTVTSHQNKSSHYVTIAEFEDTVGDGLSFKEGRPVHVNEKTESGWWFVTIDGKDGWVPASYIQSQSELIHDEDDPSVYSTIDEAEVYSDWSTDDDGDQSNVEMRRKSTKKRNSLNIAEAIKNQIQKRRSNSDPESKSDEKPKPPTRPSKANVTPSNSSKPNPSEANFNQGLANILKSKFENRNQSNDSNDNSKQSSKPFLPPKSSADMKPPLRPKSSHKPDNEGVKVVPLPVKNQNKSVPKIPAQFQKPTNEKPAPKNKPNITEKPVIGNKPNLASKPALGTKPAVGAKPVLGVKPALPSKQPTAVTSSLDKAGLPPPKLPVKQTPQSSVTSNSNKNNDNNDSESIKSGGVQGLAAALQSKFENKNSDSSVPKIENKPSVPSKLGNNAPVLSKFENKHIGPPKLPGKLNLPTKKDTESSKPSNKSKDSDKPKANVGNLVSALSGKLNFGGGSPTLGGVNPVTENGVQNNLSHVDSSISSWSYNSDNSNKIGKSLSQNSHTGNSHSQNSNLGNSRSNNSARNSKIFIVLESFHAETDQELNIEEGDEVEVCEETDTGWWMVKVHGKSGWVPSAYLVERRQNAPIEAPPVPAHATTKRTSRIMYKTCALFTAENEGELGFDEGETVDVLDKSDSEWWLIRIGRDEGWAPRSFIQQVEVEDTRGKPPAPPKIKPTFKFPMSAR